MPYSTPALVRKALVPTSDGSLPNPPSNTAADLGDTQLQDAINEADALIDGYLAKWYVTPVEGSPAPRPIQSWSRSVAAYEATLAFRGSMDFTDNDPVYRRYKAVLEALKAVAKNDLRLDLPTNTGTDDHTAGGAGAAINPYVGDLFTPDDFHLGTRDNGEAEPVFWRSPWW